MCILYHHNSNIYDHFRMIFALIYHYVCILYDLRDFHWYFISGRHKSLIFVFCCFTDLLESK
jgi:hypothetical protein